MSAALRGLAAGAVVLLLAAGCGKTEVPDRATGAPAPNDAPKVDPVVPKAAQAPTPAPGQANDHSSPGFKAGGKNDPSK
jgi:hypothetical protein